MWHFGEAEKGCVAAGKLWVVGRKWEAMQVCQAAVQSPSKAMGSLESLWAEIRGLGWLRGRVPG